MVLVRTAPDPSQIKLLMSREELATCKGDPGLFLEKLAEKGGAVGVVIRERSGGERAKV